jgi:hypothetical protein
MISVHVDVHCDGDKKRKKKGQGILNNRMRTKGEKIHVRIY